MGLPAPQFINMTQAYAGWPLTVQWSSVPGATTYTLLRRFDGQPQITVYSRPGFIFTETMPANVGSVEYAIGASIENTQTWNEHDVEVTGQAITWNTWDENVIAETIKWVIDESDKTTYVLEITPNRPSIISGTDTNLGTRYRGFSVDFNIFTELGSIAENAEKLGAPLPPFLHKVLAVCNQGSESTWDKIFKDKK